MSCNNSWKSSAASVVGAAVDAAIASRRPRPVLLVSDSEIVDDVISTVEFPVDHVTPSEYVQDNAELSHYIDYSIYHEPGVNSIWQPDSGNEAGNVDVEACFVDNAKSQVLQDRGHDITETCPAEYCHSSADAIIDSENQQDRSRSVNTQKTSAIIQLQSAETTSDKVLPLADADVSSLALAETRDRNPSVFTGGRSSLTVKPTNSAASASELCDEACPHSTISTVITSIQPRRTWRSHSFHGPMRTTRECRIPRDADNFQSRKPTLTTSRAIQQPRYTSRSHVTGSGLQKTAQCSDGFCSHDRFTSSAWTPAGVQAEDVFYVQMPGSEDGQRGGTETANSPPGGHRYVCTTGTNLYKILALSDKLSTTKNNPDTDDLQEVDPALLSSPRHQNTLPHPPKYQSTVHMMTDVESQRRLNAGITTSRGVDGDDAGDADMNANSEGDHDEITRHSEISQRHAPLQLRRHSSMDSHWRRRQPRSVLPSYKTYLSQVFRGAPKLACYGGGDDDETAFAGSKQTVTSNWLSSRSHATRTSEQTRDLAGSCQRLNLTSKSTRNEADECSSRIRRTSGAVRADHHIIHRSKSLHQHPVITSQPHSTDYVNMDREHANVNRQRQQSIMINWIRKPAVDLSMTSISDVISGHVTESGDQSSRDTSAVCDGDELFDVANDSDSARGTAAGVDGGREMCTVVDDAATSPVTQSFTAASAVRFISTLTATVAGDGAQMRTVSGSQQQQQQ